MQRLQIIPSLFLSLVAGFALAACEDDSVDAEQNPEGRACEIANEAVECGDGELVSYCGFADEEAAIEATFAEGYGGLTQGPCVAPEDNECEPGEWRSDPATDPEDICGGTDYACQVVQGSPMWVVVPCNTPLVLRFDEQPIEMIAAESTPLASFDINMRPDSCITTDWPTAATPWLVVDRDGNGSIDGGHELFGSGTKLASGTNAEHGFAALREFDGNADGVVDARDVGFGEIMLWRDHDADRHSTPDELEPLTHAGVERLNVEFDVAPDCDARGNCGVQRSAFEFAGGVGEIVDLYLSCQ